ncbi:MAG: PspC domain-containing protein [Actinomycetota bacterium]
MSSQDAERPEGQSDLPPAGAPPSSEAAAAADPAPGTEPAQSATGTESATAGFDTPPPPPPPNSPPPPPPNPSPRPASWSVPPPPVRRLVRDPDGTVGGVASGLAQHYGIDVSVVRLAFVLFTLISGVGLLLYIVAWVIIPRGDVWPPVGARQANSQLSSRELAIGAVLVGLAMIVFVSGGSVGEVLVPLLLVGGGIWLLNQSQSETTVAAPVAPAGLWNPPGGPQPQDTVVGGPSAAARTVPDPVGQVWAPPTVSPGSAQESGPGVGGTTSPLSGSQPAPRKRRRRPLRAFFIGLLLLIGGFFAVLIIALSALLIFGDIDIDTDASEIYTPSTVAEIPTAVQLNAGEVELDFSNLEPADFEDLDGPVNLDVELDAGEVRIVIPEGLDIELDAAANLGDVEVFGENEDGFGPRISVVDADPDLRLDVNVGFGAVVVERP